MLILAFYPTQGLAKIAIVILYFILKDNNQQG